ncbi:MAG: hypothetical protein WAV02_24720, partial [Stellaceae bacterium]
MTLRLIVIAAVLLLSVGGFLGAGPMPGGPFNPFGLLFLGVAGLVWFAWEPMKAGLEGRPGLFDAFARNILGTRQRKTSSGGSTP